MRTLTSPNLILKQNSKLIRNKFSGMLSLALIATMLLAACAEEGKNNSKVSKRKNATLKDKEKSAQLLEISGKVFSIPSPIQTAFLLKEAGTNYQPELLNETNRASNYVTTNSQALNLGIYGADLGYATIFDNTEDAIGYVAVTKRMSSDLGIVNLFDQAMLERFEANLGKQDSILAMVSDAFKKADQYLKNSKQNDLGVLILAGGWIETLHFATKVAESSKSQAIKDRIAEQKITIKNLINLLLPYREDEQVAQLVNQLNELKDIYADIGFRYEYREPETDPATKTTIIKSISKVDMSTDQLNAINAKVEEIRNSII